MTIDVDKYEAQLQARKYELESDNAHAVESTSTVELDQTSVGRVSRIDAMQRQAMAKAGEQRRITELSRIGAALKRVKEDEFGYCVKCGDEIASKRLDFDPSAPLCIKCASG